jgi:hypothetical protein
LHQPGHIVDIEMECDPYRTGGDPSTQRRQLRRRRAENDVDVGAEPRLFEGIEHAGGGICCVGRAEIDEDARDRPDGLPVAAHLAEAAVEQRISGAEQQFASGRDTRRIAFAMTTGRLVEQHVAVMVAIRQIVDRQNALGPGTARMLESRIEPVIVDDQKIAARRRRFFKDRRLGHGKAALDERRHDRPRGRAADKADRPSGFGQRVGQDEATANMAAADRDRGVGAKDRCARRRHRQALPQKQGARHALIRRSHGPLSP